MTKTVDDRWDGRQCVVIVAHPDDEVLWAGGVILLHPQASWTIISLCRKDDPDRSSRFFRVVEKIGAVGKMADLDDGPEQTPLDEAMIRRVIMDLLGADRFDLVITHGLQGEYTRHLRHEETGSAVMNLWEKGKLPADELWRFAYEDGQGTYLPRAKQQADYKVCLNNKIWKKKYDLIHHEYGFSEDSFEAKTTPQKEAFWCIRKNE